MSQTYEVFVDIREYLTPSEVSTRIQTARYEIDADSQKIAHDVAQGQAKSDYPQATERDIRVTRILK